MEEELRTPPLAISSDLLLEEVDANLIIEHINAPIVNTTIRHRKKKSESKVEPLEGILKNSGEGSKSSESPKNSVEVKIIETKGKFLHRMCFENV